MKVHTNLEVDDGAREQIQRQHPDGMRLPLEQRIYIPYLYFVIRVLDGAGKEIKGWKTGYWLGRGLVAELASLPVFDVTGDRDYLAVHFHNGFKEEARYYLEYFDDIFFLIKQHDALEDQNLRRIFE